MSPNGKKCEQSLIPTISPRISQLDLLDSWYWIVEVFYHPDSMIKSNLRIWKRGNFCKQNHPSGFTYMPHYADLTAAMYFRSSDRQALSALTMAAKLMEWSWQVRGRAPVGPQLCVCGLYPRIIHRTPYPSMAPHLYLKPPSGWQLERSMLWVWMPPNTKFPPFFIHLRVFVFVTHSLGWQSRG